MEPADRWLNQNYRFVPAPPAREAKPIDPVISELKEIQSTTLAIVRRAYLAGDYEAALAAASQATANAQLIGALSGRLAPPPASAQTSSAIDRSRAPLYLIAFKDETVRTAVSYWVDRFMLHYMTPAGGHEQVRLDLVDAKVSTDLNRQVHPDFQLPATVPAVN